MLDLGITKMAIIGVVALVVIGPEKLPRVARTLGSLIGRAQRYVAQVKSEVTREIELEELKKMQQGVVDAAQTIHKSVEENMQAVQSTAGQIKTEIEGDLNSAWDQAEKEDRTADIYAPARTPTKRKNWRIKQTALPSWYKRSGGVKTRIQSGAARMARYRYRPSAL